MSILIYLDQNVLSDLRSRKILSENSKEFELLKMALSAPTVIITYSHVTLSEIKQISSEVYRNEHMELLEELGARYIEPLTGILNNKKASDVWKEYIHNTELNNKMATLDLLEINQLISRKMSGLPISESFEDLNKNIKLTLIEIISNCENTLASIDLNELDEEVKPYFLNIASQLPLLKEKYKALKTLRIKASEALGPKEYRKTPIIKALDIENLPTSEVVKAIESTFQIENSNFNWNINFEDTPQNLISRAYSLMNWAGYFADDFDKVSKHGDRFNASNNDMQHVVSALDVNFLISNDVNFVKKAEACYAYANKNVQVCTSKEFLRTYCKFVKV